MGTKGIKFKARNGSGDVDEYTYAMTPSGPVLRRPGGSAVSEADARRLTVVEGTGMGVVYVAAELGMRISDRAILHMPKSAPSFNPLDRQR